MNLKTKDKVLAFLEQNRGTHISGAKIAAEIEVSRNAVWKAIKQLEIEGYEIEAITNKGYCLSETNSQMSAVGLIEQLQTSFKTTPIYYFETIDSTNKKAKELAIEGASHGTLVFANEQTAGKGRYGRSFESPKDTGIYMSLILRPQELMFNDPTILTSYAAVVVSEAIESLTGKKVGIKWVNDLFLENKKVCGILTEAVTNFENGQIEWIVLGIGINLSTSQEAFSEEVSLKAGSILATSEKEINRNQLVAKIYEGLLQTQKELTVLEVMEEYKARSIILNKRVLIQQGKKDLYVLIKDIDTAGQLIVQLDNGELKTFNSGEIRVVLN